MKSSMLPDKRVRELNRDYAYVYKYKPTNSWLRVAGDIILGTLALLGTLIIAWILMAIL